MYPETELLMSTSLPRCLPSLGAATSLLVLHLLAGPAPCQAPAGPTVAVREPLPAVAAEQIRAWVADLESDTYSARHAATERLISIGRPAVKPLADAIERGGLETIIRGIYILRQLALSAEDVQTEQEAYDALQRVAHRKLTTASRRAVRSSRSAPCR